ncbi:hypothetical protein DI392_05040 [Vibrio albus]|uniref:KfrA N-terminal DNA-binding domain-containing protein n=1 Tax=Vibrio albus TaxID=2200953 RepID=A0A2U3BCH4_9VIBR|nr:hypothetical protein [Vibrio albus]PWI34477.1 hypothetical protein DI392_05040 [Vibrio albus]
MLTKDVTEELTQIMNALHQQGKEPTLALVKARLSSPVPMPALITAIKSWKNSKKVPKVEVARQEDSDQERIRQLEQQVQELTSRIQALEEKLA